MYICNKNNEVEKGDREKALSFWQILPQGKGIPPTSGKCLPIDRQIHLSCCSLYFYTTV